jgi:hypothetical protein
MPHKNGGSSPGVGGQGEETLLDQLRNATDAGERGALYFRLAELTAKGVMTTENEKALGYCREALKSSKDPPTRIRLHQLAAGVLENKLILQPTSASIGMLNASEHGEDFVIASSSTMSPVDRAATRREIMNVYVRMLAECEEFGVPDKEVTPPSAREIRLNSAPIGTLAPPSLDTIVTTRIQDHDSLLREIREAFREEEERSKRRLDEHNRAAKRAWEIREKNNLIAYKRRALEVLKGYYSHWGGTSEELKQLLDSAPMTSTTRARIYMRATSGL